jgi:hypothetical protein
MGRNSSPNTAIMYGGHSVDIIMEIYEDPCTVLLTGKYGGPYTAILMSRKRGLCVVIIMGMYGGPYITIILGKYRGSMKPF